MTLFERAIFVQKDLDEFLGSNTFQDYVTFITEIGDSVKGFSCTSQVALLASSESKFPTVLKVNKFLATLKNLVTDTPPEKNNGSRFGNISFRKWHAKYLSEIKKLIGSLFEGSSEPLRNDIIDELSGIAANAFGHSERIDYGTGHEASFFVFLHCLDKLELFSASRLENLRLLGLLVFKKYLELVRFIQVTYRLEPAGSHGVWSLDDFQCLVFFIGSCQLDSPNFRLSPKILKGKAIDSSLSHDFLLVAQMEHTLATKTGQIEHHTPILAELSSARKWEELCSGFLGVFQGEVLGKLPVVQHFVFGNVFPATWVPDKHLNTMKGPISPFALKSTPSRDLVSKYFKLKKKPKVKGLDFIGRLKNTLLESEGGKSLVNEKQIATRGWEITVQDKSTSAYEAERNELERTYSTDEGEFNLPEQFFTGNFVRLEKGQFSLEVNSLGAVLGSLNVLPDSNMNGVYVNHERERFLVFQSKFWKNKKDLDKQISDAVDINFDWTFTTSYLYTLKNERSIQELDSTSIDYDLLKRREEFLLYAKVTFYEDDLDDFGISRFSSKIRVMTSCIFMLSRCFLRVDRKYVRVFDTRIFHKFGSEVVSVEVQRRELDTEGEEYRSIEIKAKPDIIDQVLDKIPVGFSAYFDISI